MRINRQYAVKTINVNEEYSQFAPAQQRFHIYYVFPFSCNDCPSTSVVRIAAMTTPTGLSILLSFHDLRGLSLRCLPSTVPCSMIFGSVL